MDTLPANLRQKAAELGFTMMGVTPARPARRLEAYMRWVEAEMYGRMTYMARPDRIIRRQDLNVILPGVKTIVCVGLDYYTHRLPDAIAQDPSRGRISNYAWNRDYHDIMLPRLQELADWLAAGADTAVAHRVYTDTGAILERDHAASAGLGFTGKNTLLIHPRRGSYFFLGEILTTLEIGDWGIGDSPAPPPLTPSSPHPLTPSLPHSLTPPPPTCGTCRRCLDTCPTHAFPEPYVLDARRCISYLTIELKGWIPRELRPLMGNWIYGCDICQEVCPFNRFARPTQEEGFQPTSLWDSAAPSLLEILALDEAGFKERFAHSPIKRIKRARLVRNACVAAGNWGSETAVPCLIPLLADPEPIVRGHAAWALHQIGGGEAQSALASALNREKDTAVLAELKGKTVKNTNSEKSYL
ncbi:MAG TPA: tRNA epoxyqueuosine(34) reductase QueG [Anaerolineae bacterium]|nr:tRNA epoxyqueuosine(34) reductase QueG [Anaerolineae bacterium]